MNCGDQRGGESRGVDESRLCPDEREYGALRGSVGVTSARVRSFWSWPHTADEYALLLLRLLPVVHETAVIGRARGVCCLWGNATQ
jgi:hypothetical protein